MLLVVLFETKFFYSVGEASYTKEGDFMRFKNIRFHVFAIFNYKTSLPEVINTESWNRKLAVTTSYLNQIGYAWVYSWQQKPLFPR